MFSLNDNEGLPRGGRDSGSVYDRILYWDPAAKETPEPSGGGGDRLTIGYIGSSELYRDLVYDADVHILTPNNCRYVGSHGQLDFLLVESAWNYLVPAWYQSHHPESRLQPLLRSVLDLARNAGCPSVLWLTMGADYVDDYVAHARYFDYVFAADAASVARFREQGIRCSLLGPWVQPRLYNPFVDFHLKGQPSFPVYFDGWADVERNPSSYDVLSEVAEQYGLAIFDSRYRVPAVRAQTVPALTSSIKGVLTERNHPTALRRAQISVSFTQTIAPSPVQQQKAIQAAASKALPVHVGRLESDDPRHGLVHTVDGDQGLLDFLDELENDPAKRKRLQHVAWREAVKNQTLQHRLSSICKVLGIRYGWNEWPMVSAITPTCRPDALPTSIENFDRQTYANKELVVVINGDGSTAERLQAQYADRKDITWDSVPADRFTGSTLNRGNLRADSDLGVKMDDDDIYGAHYLEDIVLSLRCFDADVLGKVRAPMLFEGEESVFQHRRNHESHVVATGEDLAMRRLWLGGNTLCWRRSALSEQPFADDLIGAVDSVFNQNLPAAAPVLVLDPYNVLAVRKEDLEQHTSRTEKEWLQANSEMAGTLEDWLF